MKLIKQFIFACALLGAAPFNQHVFANQQQEHLNNICGLVNDLLRQYPELSQTYLAGIVIDQVVEEGVKLSTVKAATMSLCYPAMYFTAISAITNLGHAFVVLSSLIGMEGFSAVEAGYTERPQFEYQRCRMAIPVNIQKISGRVYEDKQLEQLKRERAATVLWLEENVERLKGADVIQLKTIPTTDIVSVERIRFIIGHVKRVLTQILSSNKLTQSVINLYSSFITGQTNIVADGVPEDVRIAVEREIRKILGATKSLREKVKATGVKEILFKHLHDIENELKVLEELQRQGVSAKAEPVEEEPAVGTKRRRK